MGGVKDWHWSRVGIDFEWESQGRLDFEQSEFGSGEEGFLVLRLAHSGYRCGKSFCIIQEQ